MWKDERLFVVAGKDYAGMPASVSAVNQLAKALLIIRDSKICSLHLMVWVRSYIHRGPAQNLFQELLCFDGSL